MIDDNKNCGGGIFPGVHINYEQFDDAEVDEEHDDGDDDEEEVGIFFSEFLEHWIRLLLFKQIYSQVSSFISDGGFIRGGREIREG